MVEAGKVCMRPPGWVRSRLVLPPRSPCHPLSKAPRLPMGTQRVALPVAPSSANSGPHTRQHVRLCPPSSAPTSANPCHVSARHLALRLEAFPSSLRP